MKANYLIEIK